MKTAMSKSTYYDLEENLPDLTLEDMIPWPQMTIPRPSPFIWATWLPKLLVGENNCKWACWFKAHNQYYDKTPSNFDLAVWQMKHTTLLNRTREEFEALGQKVFLESQNKFELKGQTATLCGKPDMVTLSASGATVCDVKTGKQKASDQIQVMLYMWALPQCGQHRGRVFDGLLIYENNRLPIPASSVDDDFKSKVIDVIKKVGSSTPMNKIPSIDECQYCEITKVDCPERIERESVADATDLF